MTKTKQRDYYWDTLKVVLIFLVVLGHTVTHYSEKGSLDCATYNWIFSFHMPLFIFISGRFSHVKDNHKYLLGILRIVETYVVFQIIRYFLAQRLGQTEANLNIFLFAQYALWYLQCLVWWRLLVFIVSEKRMNDHKLLIITLSILLAITFGFTPLRLFSIQRTFAFLPFFLLGYFSSSIDTKRLAHVLPLPIAIIGLAGVFALFYFKLDYKLTVFYYNMPFEGVKDCVARIAALLLSSFMCLAFMRIIPLGKSWLSKYRGATLFVYMFHTFATREVLNKITSLSNVTPVFPLLLLYALLTTAVLIWLSRFSFSSIMLNPISAFISLFVKKQEK